MTKGKNKKAEYITLYRYFEKLEKFLEDPLYTVENYNVTMKQFDDLCQVVFAPVRFTRGITTGLSINAYKIRQMSQGIYQNMGSRIVPRDIIIDVMPSYKNREEQDKIVKELKNYALIEGGKRIPFYDSVENIKGSLRLYINPMFSSPIETLLWLMADNGFIIC